MCVNLMYLITVVLYFTSLPLTHSFLLEPYVRGHLAVLPHCAREGVYPGIGHSLPQQDRSARGQDRNNKRQGLLPCIRRLVSVIGPFVACRSDEVLVADVLVNFHSITSIEKYQILILLSREYKENELC